MQTKKEYVCKTKKCMFSKFKKNMYDKQTKNMYGKQKIVSKKIQMSLLCHRSKYSSTEIVYS